MKVSGKVAVIFGGARGIGLACAKRLLQEGAKVCLADIRDELGVEVCAELNTLHPDCACFIKCDITDDLQIQGVFSGATSKLGIIEICINSAGIGNEESWKRMMDINLIGLMSSSYSAKQWMSSANEKAGGKGGVIVQISSTAGVKPFDTMPAYSASKAAIVGFMKAFATKKYFDRDGIRMNTICPGVVLTDLLDEIITTKGTQEEWVAIIEKARPTGVMPMQIADAVLRVVEDDTMNGEALLFKRDGSSEVLDYSDWNAKVDEIILT